MNREISEHTKRRKPLKYFQLRMDYELFDALVAEVEQRQRRGLDASLNSVGIEWLARGRDTQEAPG